MKPQNYTPLPDDTQPGSLTVQRPHMPPPFTPPTLPLLTRPISVQTTPLLLPPADTQQGSQNVQRPHMHPLHDTTPPILYSPDHCYNTPCLCCLSCSYTCLAPRVYPLPARTSRRLRGGSPVGGHGDVFSGGSPWTVTGHLLDLPCFARFLLVHPLSTCYIYTR